MVHEWDLDMFHKQSDHALQMQKLEIEAKKLELKLKQEDRLAARKHQQLMKELELEIRAYETKWNQLLRVPITLIKLPVMILFGIAICIAAGRNRTVESREFWTFMR